MKKIPQAQLQFIADQGRALYGKGHSLRDISAILEDVYEVSVSIETLRKAFVNPTVSTEEDIEKVKMINYRKPNRHVPRQQIYELLEDGLTCKEIAERLSLSLSTTKRAKREQDAYRLTGTYKSSR